MKIVGISACPAGLAHTPMAAKALEKAGKKLGYDVKIEQQGSLGQVNKISQQEANEADFVLLATDQKVIGLERFDGKPQLRVSINTCIKAPEAVLKKCIEAVKERQTSN
ncbi:PTS fructose transporter subunit IIB [Carnobacterium maltaromaticum]|uniref:PTS fructose transporter subunit IIB n=1 Tax=Carnobacterium maltaromaticum TaxID=2751 RepID=UPI0039BE9F72